MTGAASMIRTAKGEPHVPPLRLLRFTATVLTVLALLLDCNVSLIGAGY